MDNRSVFTFVAVSTGTSCRFIWIAVFLAAVALSGCARSEGRMSAPAAQYPIEAAYYPPAERIFVGNYQTGAVREYDSSGRSSSDAAFGADRDKDARALRIKVDAARARLWVLDIGKAVLYDIATKRLLKRVPLPGWYMARYNCLPDIALDKSGALFVSNNIMPKLWRVDPDTFEVSRQDIALAVEQSTDAGFSGLAFAADGKTLYAVTAATGSLWRIDIGIQHAELIKLPSRLRGACALIHTNTTKGPVLSVMIADGFPAAIHQIGLSADGAQERNLRTVPVADSSGLIEKNSRPHILKLQPSGRLTMTEVMPIVDPAISSKRSRERPASLTFDGAPLAAYSNLAPLARQ
jgi:hypothetical protein